MTKHFRFLGNAYNPMRRVLSNCITNLPMNLNVKALIYSLETKNFVALEGDKLFCYRIGNNLDELNPQKLITLFDEYNKNRLHSRNIFNTSFAIERLFQEFDQESYLEFVAKLNKVAVEILKIKQNRNNIAFYNHSIPSKNLNLEGKDYETAVRSLSKAIYFLPFLKEIIDYDPKEGQRILNNFLPSSKVDPIKSLNDYLKTPYAPPSFYRRVGNMRMHLIKEMHDFVFHGIVNINGAVDNQLYENRIVNIPIANSVNKDAHDSLKEIIKIFNQNKFFTKKAKQEMLEAVAYKNEWNKNKEVILLNDFEPLIKEYIFAIALRLILPSYIEKFNEKFTISFNKTDKPFPDKYDHWFVKYIIKEISSFLQDTLIKDAPRKIYEYSKKYENKSSKINSRGLLLIENLDDQKPVLHWHKAFEDYEINGVKFRCLVNEKELREEASYVNHCAAGYGPRCLEGIRHVVSGIVEESGERFTLRFSTNGKDRFVYDEYVAEKNETGERKFLSQEAKNSIQILLENIESRKIVLNPIFGNLNKNLTIIDVIGFDFTNKQQQEDLFQEFNTYNTLPTIATSLEDFKIEIGLDEFLNKVIDQHNTLLLENSQNPPSTIALSIGYKPLKGPRESCGYLD